MTKSFVSNNGRFKILTSDGFSDFVGVTESVGSFNMLHIEHENGSCKTTVDHEIYTSIDSHKPASEFNIGAQIYTSDDVQHVINITSYSSDRTYDIIHVSKKNQFFSCVQNSKCMILKKNCLYLDELGFVNDAEAFYESVYPTISSSDESKVIITSTPKGMNFFYKLWVEAESGRNEYVAYDVKWYEHPDRDQKWYESQVSNLNAKSVDQEINCVSGDTYINVNGEQITIERLYNTLGGNTSNRVVWVDDCDIIIDR